MIFLSYLILKSYFIALISAFILSYLLMPLYKRLNPKLGKTLSALICILVFLIILVIPLASIGKSLINQTTDSLKSGGFESLIDKFSNLELIEKLNINLEELTEKSITFILSLFTNALSYLPSILITLLIIIFGIYYILTNWNSLSSQLKKYIPFENKKKISKEIKETTKGLIYGTLLIAFIEFLIALLGFYISGVRFYFLLPAIMFFLAFIPALGPTIVWMPVAIYYLFTGNYLAFIGVLITGLILTILIDTILRAKIMGKQANINPFILLIGVLGGVSVFGIFGFIIGPLILVYTIKIIQEIVKSNWIQNIFI